MNRRKVKKKTAWLWLPVGAPLTAAASESPLRAASLLSESTHPGPDGQQTSRQHQPRQMIRTLVCLFKHSCSEAVLHHQPHTHTRGYTKLLDLCARLASTHTVSD